MFFNKHMNIETINVEKKLENNFTRNTRISRAKNDGKRSSGKSAKTRSFYKHTNIVFKKWGEKNARKKFSKNTRIDYQKIIGKKSSGKSAKTRF